VALLLIVLPLAAYFLGSVSFAFLAGKLKGIDLREHGSGNLGATNVGRVLGGRWFATVFLCDVAKGAVPVLAARFLPAVLGYETEAVEHQVLMIAAGTGAILGHVFTLFHHFRGGKAVATSLGVLVALLPALAGLCALVWTVAWALAAFAFKAEKSAAVGPASVLAALAAPACWWLLVDDPLATDTRILTAFVVLLSALVVIRHRSNIAKMLKAGREPGGSGEWGVGRLLRRLVGW